MQGWRRTYRAVWAANFVTAVGMMSFLPFFPSHLEELGLTDAEEIAAWAGILYGAAPLTAALMGPIWGVLGDRYGRRLMVLRSMLAITLFVGAMYLARDPWELLALRVAQGLFSGFVAPSLTLVSIAAPAGAQGRIAGTLQTSMIWGMIAGPALGEGVRATWGVREIYLAVAALSALGALLVAVFAREDPTQRRASTPGTGLRTALRESLGDLGELRRNRTVRAAVLLLFGMQFGLGATNPLLELYVRELRTSVAWISPSTAALFSAMALASLVAMPLWGRYGDRKGHYRALLRCSAWSAAALLLHAAAPGYEVLLLARVALGVAMAGSAPLAFGVAAAESSAQRRGGAFGVVFSARALAVSLAAVSGGFLSALVGIRGLFVGAAFLVAGCLALLSRARPSAEAASGGAGG
ncbi:MAG TPA: MFS transporter [Planctomycetota bacterium]|nr:MFS transporter [Planctomycetota bacterium]